MLHNLQLNLYLPSAANISKTVVQTLRTCAEVYRTCKNLEDEAIAYIARSHYHTYLKYFLWI